MASPVMPFAKAIFLCDMVIGSENSKVDLYGIFNSINPKKYPYTLKRFCCFAQLAGGLGHVPFHFDIRRADDDSLVRCTDLHRITFKDRSVVQFLSLTIENCVFEKPGLYLVQLFCDNVWIADATLLMGERE